MAAARPTSMRASSVALPAPRAISAASSPSRPPMMFAASIRMAPREAGSIAFHSGRADVAASMARSVSALSDFGVVPRISDGFEGFTTSEVSPESAGTHAPPTKFRASVWDSIMVSSNSARGAIAVFLPDLRASYLALGHLVLQYEPADGDLDPAPGRRRELVTPPHACAAHTA